MHPRPAVAEPTAIMAHPRRNHTRGLPVSPQRRGEVRSSSPPPRGGGSAGPAGGLPATLRTELPAAATTVTPPAMVARTAVSSVALWELPKDMDAMEPTAPR